MVCGDFGLIVLVGLVCVSGGCLFCSLVVCCLLTMGCTLCGLVGCVSLCSSGGLLVVGFSVGYVILCLRFG